jgi:hypothetical protein
MHLDKLHQRLRHNYDSSSTSHFCNSHSTTTNYCDHRSTANSKTLAPHNCHHEGTQTLKGIAATTHMMGFWLIASIVAPIPAMVVLAIA